MGAGNIFLPYNYVRKDEIIPMIVLTIYTDKFDSRSNVCGKGMSGKVFLEDCESGQEFKAIDEALDHCEKNNIKIDRIDFHYLGNDDIQKFWKFNIQ